MITRKDAAAVMDRVFGECQSLRDAGQKEYAHDDQNALANFERQAAAYGIAREAVLMIYAGKHWDGICAYVKGHRSQRESVTGRINDMIVYLTLLRCMVEDSASSTPTSSETR